MRSVDRVLVTGGAGFIGSWTADLLVEEGYKVTILDSLEPQVHRGRVPGYLNEGAAFVRGDVRDRGLLRRLVKEADAVVHLAAAVGVGQSMYQVERYVDYNAGGTATLLDVLVNEESDVRKLVVASSMSIYGEGKAICENCGPVHPPLRPEDQLKKGVWENRCPDCGEALGPMATDEGTPPQPTSIYAITKRDQEEMCMVIGKTYGIPTVALRYFNAYGPRQALSNPYTGVGAIFCCRLLNNKPPIIFEDGGQTRDFVHVSDVARANLLALEKRSADYECFNVGTGRATSIGELAETLIDVFGSDLRPVVTGRYRKGDVRHCYADISKIRGLLGYEPKVRLEEGVKGLIAWMAEQEGVEDRFEEALSELEKMGLL